MNQPEFQRWTNTLPPAIVQAARGDAGALQHVINQYRGAMGNPSPTLQPETVQRVIPIGPAMGVPGGRAPIMPTIPGFTRSQIVNMPEKERRERDSEILAAYANGLVRDG